MNSTAEAQQRLLAHLLDTARSAAARGGRGPDGQPGGIWLAEATDELERCAHVALDLGWVHGPTLAALAGHWLRSTGRPRRDLCTRLNEAATEQGDPQGRAAAQWGFGWHALGDLDVHEAADRFNEARSVVDDDEYGQAEADLGLATVARLRGDLAQAETLFEQAAACYRRAGDDRAEADAAWGLAIVELERGNGAQAMARFERASDLCRQARGRPGRPTRGDLVAAAVDAGLGQVGRDLLQIASVTVPEQHHEMDSTVADAVANITGVLEDAATGSQAAKDDPFSELVEAISRIGDQMAEGMSRAFQSITVQIASPALAFSLYQEVGDNGLQAAAAYAVASAAVETSHLAAAAAGYDVALELFTRTGDARGQAASRRVLDDIARALAPLDHLRAGADAGDSQAARRLAKALAQQGEVAELRQRADAGDKDAAWRFADLLVRTGQQAELRDRAEAGDEDARRRYAELLDDEGREAELVARADAGDEHAGWRLARLLVGSGRLQELCARADAGDGPARSEYADLLTKRGHLDELRARAHGGDLIAADRLVEVLLDDENQSPPAGRDERIPEAIDLLRMLADADDSMKLAGYSLFAGNSEKLCDLLAEEGRLEELAARATAGDYCAWYLLYRQGLSEDLPMPTDDP
ncbi:tetratricopeptide repeat protein [Actinomadura spongiicola]|uniref:Tetratricopeptide repeat protein n=1 Tax=Actinomadura spongiicola TaxID=2303421 RepID=A0A372GLK9_9ACTN|nr:tetratricopeptide repeat protein [Actinomadura spongiicola]RFS85979.1 tetratricopeptide repeat protein [Actinomadura spongiicola]